MGHTHGRIGQDRMLDRAVFRGMHDGVFVDIGAFDGVTGSNTLFFEERRDWTGICVEADPFRFRELAARRSAACFNLVVDGASAAANVAAEIPVRTETLTAVLDAMPAMTREVHLLSIATPGNSAAILGSIDHRARTIHVIDVGCATEATLSPLLAALGPDYLLVARSGRDAFFFNRRSRYLRRAEDFRSAMRLWMLKDRLMSVVRTPLLGEAARP